MFVIVPTLRVAMQCQTLRVTRLGNPMTLTGADNNSLSDDANQHFDRTLARRCPRIVKSPERDMTEEVHMVTQNNDPSLNRNDPAINPETPDSSLAQNDALKQQQSGSQGQAPDATQTQENKGAAEGEKNSFTPDFEPHEHESPDTTKAARQTGEVDKDIDTADS